MQFQTPANNFLFYYFVGKSIKKKDMNANPNNLVNRVITKYCKN